METVADVADTQHHPGNGRPDPTDRTTQLVDRAVDAFREVMETRLAGMDRATELVAQALQAFRAEADVLQQRQREATTSEIGARVALFDARIGAMDKATELLAATVGQVPSDTDKQVNALRELLGARIDGMDVATELLATNVREVPTDIDKAARALREILQGEIRNVADVADEKFKAIDGTFGSNALALTAALAAQKEAACMSADTPVLCADLIWRPAGDLLPGDELIAFDEEADPLQDSRCYRRATVTANALERDALLRVNTPMGHVRCTYDHPWLVRRWRGHPWEWRRADTLRPGDVVMKPLDVWDVDRSYNAGWLAGILDGEGCLGFKSRRNGSGKLSIGQVDGVVADRIDEVLKATGVALSRHVRPAQGYSSGGYTGQAKEQRRWEINGRADIMRILGTVRPSRFLISSDQVWEGFAIKSTSQQGSRLTPVESIESAGTGMVARLSTSTRTYIGAGFAMHNSEQNKSNTLAITKSEVATKEKIDSNALQTATSLKSLADRLDDLKERVDRGEGSDAGQQSVSGSPFESATLRQAESTARIAQQRALTSSIIAGLAVLVSVISVIILIVHK